MDYITLGAFCFICVFAVWGFFRGFWKSLAAIVSLVLAYLASALLATPCTHILVENFKLTSVNEQLLWVICGITLFMVVGFTTRLGILMLSKSLPIDNVIVNRSSGAILSGGYGAALVVFIVWALSFSLEAVNGATGVVNKFDIKSGNEAPLVVKWSRTIMSEILKWNAKSGGASEAVGEVTQAFAKNPTEILASFKSTMVAPEFKALISNPRLQELVRVNDFESIKDSSEYKNLMASSKVQHLQSVLAPSDSVEAKNEITDYLLGLWHDVDRVKNDAEIQNLLHDPEMQNFLNGGGGQISLTLLSKGKDLLQRIGAKADSSLPPMPDVYKWYDKKGVIHVTDWEDVPLDKQQLAQRISSQ